MAFWFLRIPVLEGKLTSLRRKVSRSRQKTASPSVEVESFFGWSGLGLLKAYGPRPDIVFTFLNNPADEANEETDHEDKENDVKVLVVQLLSKTPG